MGRVPHSDQGGVGLRDHRAEPGGCPTEPLSADQAGWYRVRDDGTHRRARS